MTEQDVSKLLQDDEENENHKLEWRTNALEQTILTHHYVRYEEKYLDECGNLVPDKVNLKTISQVHKSKSLYLDKYNKEREKFYLAQRIKDECICALDVYFDNFRKLIEELS